MHFLVNLESPLFPISVHLALDLNVGSVRGLRVNSYHEVAKRRQKESI